MLLSNRSYEFGKKLVQVILPAIASLYFGLASIWGLPAAEQVVGTIAVITTFLGVCLGISSKTYRELAEFGGKIVVTETEEGRTLYSLEVDGDPEDIEKLSSVTFKVESHKS